MEFIPQLVQDLNLRQLTNSVIVAVCKFTADEVYKTINQEGFGCPEKLKKQVQSYRVAWAGLNEAYAQQRKMLQTEQISALDTEGDQLIYAVKGTVEAALRMTFDTERYSRAQYFNEFFRKYRIDPTENMISEWSKVQQACEEWQTNHQLELAGKALGIDGAMGRLKTIASEIRRLLTERNAAMPTAQAMKQAREAIYPEYRALMQILNAFIIVDEDEGYKYQELVNTLNKNIDYVRIHAITKGDGAEEDDGSEDEGGSSDEGGEKADGSESAAV